MVIKVITKQILSILLFYIVSRKQQRICSLNVIVNELIWKHCALPLREVETWKLVLHARWISSMPKRRVVNIEHRTRQSRPHLPSIIPVHS